MEASLKEFLNPDFIGLSDKKFFYITVEDRGYHLNNIALCFENLIRGINKGIKPNNSSFTNILGPFFI